MREVHNQRESKVLHGYWSPGVRGIDVSIGSAMADCRKFGSTWLWRNIKIGRSLKLGYALGVGIGMVVAAYYGGV